MSRHPHLEFGVEGADVMSLNDSRKQWLSLLLKMPDLRRSGLARLLLLIDEEREPQMRLRDYHCSYLPLLLRPLPRRQLQTMLSFRRRGLSPWVKRRDAGQTR
jgi:hypothetical protein